MNTGGFQLPVLWDNQGLDGEFKNKNFVEETCLNCFAY